MTLEEYLKESGRRYNSKLGLLGVKFKNPGYHSKVPSGTWVHPMRESLDYALELLNEGSRRHASRACDILRRVISLQDQDEASPTYGIWSWLYEEPLDAMSPPDWNWADFCGLNLAEIGVRHKKRLPAPLRVRILESLNHAAGAIYRRNMGPHYTNIAIMGGIVTSLAGEILRDKRWLGYGRRRLEKCVEHFQFHGGYNEYNSPTYTWVVARDCERGLRLLSGAAARRQVKFLWHAAWKTIAEHFHPPTGQLAGPQSRSYSTFLSAGFLDWISARTGTSLRAYTLKGAATHHEAEYEGSSCLPCPPALRNHFRQAPAKSYAIKRRFIRGSGKNASTWGTTWFAPHACVGSVNRDFSWDQRRAVLAYWVGDSGKPVSVRLRFLHDGREFASCYMFNRQVGPKVLSAIHLLLDRGDFHPYFDKPPDNVFLARDFRVSYEFMGENLNVAALPDGRFIVSTGSCQACVTPAASVFGDVKAAWSTSRGENSINVDGVLYHGRQRAFDFKRLFPVRIAVGLEISESKSTPKFAPMKWQRHSAGNAISWAGDPNFKITFPERAVTCEE